MTFNPIHLAYGIMIVGIIFCFVISKNVKKDMRSGCDRFAFAFAKLSNYICPNKMTKGFLAETLSDGRVCVADAEHQSGTIRAVMTRANEETSVQLFQELVDAYDEVEKLAGSNKTNKRQFSQPVHEILLMTHTFLNGCEDPSTIDTQEKLDACNSFLMDQVTHRMTLLRRISGASSDAYRDLNTLYQEEMEAVEKEELDKKKKGSN